MAQAAYQVPTQGVLFEVVQSANRRYGVVTVPSSDGKRNYRVDVTNGRCDCPAWKFQKGHTKACKHLKAMGFSDLVREETDFSKVL
jgi:hypothetical protein